jgi:hypothetical protein
MALLRTLSVALAIVLAACGGCDESTAGNNGDGTNANAGNAGNAGTNSVPITDTNSPFEMNESGEVLCGDTACACDDGADNDGDGLVDLQDPECTGPYDDDEGTFATGIPGDNKDDCQDCFFDGNSGHGDDGCQYATECLLGGNPMGASGCKNCEVADQCYDFCRPRTPNGCDCFGCCEVTLEDGSTETVVLGGSCSLDDLSQCETGCVINEECSNSCGRCELCLGKEVEDLPADCFESGDDMGTPPSDAGDTPVHTCEDGEVPCNQTSDCPNNHYCQLGCCIEIIL